MKYLFFSSVLFYASAYALEWPGAKPTSIAEDEASLQEGWTPRPTGGPDSPIDLLRRADAGPVCGYESGVAASSLTCSPNYSCLYFTDVGLGACCSGKNYIRDCGLFATCVDYVQYRSSNACSTTCDQFTFVCTDSARPYCQSYLYPEVSVEQFGCGINSASTWRKVGTTYSGQSALNTGLRYTTALSVSSVPSIPGILRTGSSGSSSAVLLSSSSVVPLPTPLPTKKDDDDHHVSIGAIVGGVVGGLFAIGALIAGLVFFCLRSRKRKRNLAAAAAGPTHQPQDASQQPMKQTQPIPQSPPPQQQAFSPAPQAAAPTGFYAPTPPPQENKKPGYTTQTQSYYGSDISVPGSPPPPQYAQAGAGGYIQPPVNRTDGTVSPLTSTGGETMTPQHTGVSAMGNPHADTLGGDGVAQLADTGSYNQAGHDQAGYGQAGQAQPGRKPVGGNPNVYEAP